MSELEQTVMIEVDEAGTRAAAATMARVSKMGGAMNKLKISFDRPFIFIIRHQETPDAVPKIIFMGTVFNPSNQ